MYIFLLSVGIIIGFLISKSIPLVREMLDSSRPKKWRVRFHTYFVMHENGQLTNSAIKSPSIELFVSAKNESEAGDLILEMIEKELRIDIESIELWLSDGQ
jgi:hypothetical protein